MRVLHPDPHDPHMTDSLHRSTGERSTTQELIALGRDREAVVAATQEGHPMDGVDQLDQIIPMLEAIVGGITREQLANETPCKGFTVEGVLEHMIGGATAFAPAFRGGTGAASSVSSTVGGTPHERFRRAMTDLLDAVHAPGAQERTIASPFGEVPGATFARYVAFDGLVHGWDLSISTGQPYTPDGALVREVDGFIRQLLTAQMRDGDTFEDETVAPRDSSPLEQLVAFSGRQVSEVNRVNRKGRRQ
jgi:uncharacterized protein (TIGR03086 family)